jgi:hypothetical protein
MKFLKDNLFYVILGGGTLVAAAVLLVLQMGPAEQIEQGVQDRVALRDTLGRLRRPPHVNGAVLDALQQRSEQLRQDLARVSELALEWNRSGLEVLELNLDVEDIQGPLPAFPIDRPVYERNLLNFNLNFSDQYRRAMQDLRESLRPARRIDAEQIRQRTEQIRDELKQLEELGTFPEDLPGSSADDPVPGGSTPGGSTPGENDPARRLALQELIWQSSSSGAIYLDPNVFEVSFTAETEAAYQKLWWAQVNLWIRGEIVRAIRRTNEEVLADLPAEQRNVRSAAVKRLVSIDAPSAYVGGMTGRGAAGPGMGAGSERTENLTGRTSTSEYDVLHYAFTVDLPFRHALRLQRSLLRENNHTILQVEIEDLPAEPLEDNLYFGPEPVVRMTLRCELLLLSGWERGTLAEGSPSRGSELQWELPPLMPLEVLESLPESALRQIDRQRLRAAGRMR